MDNMVHGVGMHRVEVEMEWTHLPYFVRSFDLSWVIMIEQVCIVGWALALGFIYFTTRYSVS